MRQKESWFLIDNFEEQPSTNEDSECERKTGERERSSSPLPLPYRSRTDVDSASLNNVAISCVNRPGSIAAHGVIFSSIPSCPRILETKTRMNHRGQKVVLFQISPVSPCIVLKLSGELIGSSRAWAKFFLILKFWRISYGKSQCRPPGWHRDLL